ncbi:MAG TPA: imidazole glycerol phosphate synthase subunit HisH [Verrucomicrobiae bacterium]|nr:imidazole glycerol phosphate synthase subunit HisH [Verrucomicrobiae bacterium]
MAETIGIIDYGMGNLHSLGKALERVSSSQHVVISWDADELRSCDKLVLPGVGGVKACMSELKRLELNELVREQAKQVPILGVCLGMQVLHEWSDENGGVPALGVIPGKVVRFPDPPLEATERLKVPHMGWNRVKQAGKHPLWANVPDDSWFYFVHSYHSVPRDKKHVLGTAQYVHEFPAVVAKENVAAVQFHPEKSQIAGMTLLANFVGWDGKS